jgi:hypothetical protein
LERVRLSGFTLWANLHCVGSWGTNRVVERKRAGTGRNHTRDRSGKGDEQQNACEAHETPFRDVQAFPDPCLDGPMVAAIADVTTALDRLQYRF